MQRIAQDMAKTHGDKWMQDNDLRTEFYGKIQQEARGRLDYKSCCFFSPIRNAHLSQFYQFLSKLPVNRAGDVQVSHANLREIHQLHAVQSIVHVTESQARQDAVPALRV
jgi:hypothetical protein